MKVAAIDIGTNSIHMVVARVEAHGIFEIVDREKEMVFLGKGSLLTGALPLSNIQRGLSALKTLKAIADTHLVDRIICAATSAVREARNARFFIDLVRKETGVSVRVLSGKEEARLITLAVRDAVDLKDRKALIVDIGGGSVEFIVADARHIYFAESMRAGVIRLTERFLKKDPASAKELRRLQRWIRKRLYGISRTIQDLSPDLAIGTSGTILAFGQMLAASRDRVSKAENNTISVEDVEKLNQRLRQADLKERERFPGLDRRRASQIVAGGALLETILEKCRVNEILLCDRALREGLIADLIVGRTSAQSSAMQARELRRKSVVNVLHRWELDRKHAEHVTRLALQVFDGLAERHKLGPDQRELLEYACLLHDIGRAISYAGHHRHSWYIIRHANLIGFQPAEVEVMAAIAAYHRRKNPKKQDVYLQKLKKRNRNIVRALGAILRIADALDRQHNRSVAEVRAQASEDGDVVFLVRATQSCIVSLKAALERCALLRRTLKLRNIQFQVKDLPEATAVG